MNFVYYMLIPSRDAFLRMASSRRHTTAVVSAPRALGLGPGRPSENSAQCGTLALPQEAVRTCIKDTL